jgi:hypothetical protein
MHMLSKQKYSAQEYITSGQTSEIRSIAKDQAWYAPTSNAWPYFLYNGHATLVYRSYKTEQEQA